MYTNLEFPQKQSFITINIFFLLNKLDVFFFKLNFGLVKQKTIISYTIMIIIISYTNNNTIVKKLQNMYSKNTFGN